MWRNKPEIDTLSLDYIYNNLKIYEPKVKGTSSSSSNIQNVDFVSLNSNSSTNGVVNTAHGVTTTSTQATVVNSTTIDNLSDAVLLCFLCKSTKQRFLKNTERKFSVNGTKTIGFDKSKVKHFTTTTKGDTFQGSAGLQGTKKTGIRRTQEGLCQWRQILLILCSNSEVSTDSNCSSSCLENVKILKEQNEQLLKDLRTSKLNAIAYKTGLESAEARPLVYKKNESVYEEDIKVLKRVIHLREVAITELRRKLEMAQKKDEIQLTVENFKNSSKSLSNLIDCQIVDKCKKV
ncbi:hypothetical protein Tco_0266771 [Tanacetum coccineum]